MERGGHPKDPLQGGPRYWVSQGRFFQSGAACEQAEAEAVHLANEMQAEYWSVSAKTGEYPTVHLLPKDCGRRGPKSKAGNPSCGGGVRSEREDAQCLAHRR